MPTAFAPRARPMLSSAADVSVAELDDGVPVTERLPVATPEEELRIVVGSATDAAGRTENEDAVDVSELAPVGSGPAAAEPGFLLAVADGMGGYQRGAVASQLAIATVREMFADDPGADPALLLKQAFRRANEQIYENGLGTGPAAMMGTTLVVVTTRGKYATIASIGDSRAYLARAKRLTQITKDHSLVADQVAQGAISEAEARSSPHRNILTHALGHRPKLDSKMPNIFEITLLPEDRLLVCTDGFYDVVPNDDLLRVLLESDPDEASRRLVDLATERGTSDNVSAVVLAVMPARVPEPAPAAAGAQETRQSFLVPALIFLVVVIVIAAVLLYLLTS